MPVDAAGQELPLADAPSLGQVLEVIRPQVEKIEEGFTAIRVTLDALAEHFSGAAPGFNRPAASSPPAAVPAQPLPRAAAPPPPVASPVAVASAQRTHAAPAPRPAGDRSGKPAASSGEDWSRILFGPRGPAAGITQLSGTLLADVYGDDDSAVGLAGQIMTFRTAAAEQKPRLLKEMGEAFYAWKPLGAPGLIEPLIAWAHAELDTANLGNRIMIVQVGDRYDMQRHNARQAGVEIAEVLGWVVLRDNGKVYSKANVTVR